jgi:restriction endonuclease S subunit
MANSNSSLSLSPSSLKKGWQIVKFGEIAKNISKRVNPSETDLEVYVGLEHLDPQSLRITRRGVPADVKGQKLRVRPGQIIFGKRRAYQKKVAVADFDGICSAHAMVLEAVPGKIIPELLPFFMQSDMFMDRAVAISECSLSPTIKWKTLAIQKFSLPPLERQKEILEVLEKVEENIGIYEGAFEASKDLRKAIRFNFLYRGLNGSDSEQSHWGIKPKGWKMMPLSEIASINPKYSIEKNEPIQFCEMAAVGNDSMSIEGEFEIRHKVSGGARFKNGDVIFARITPCAENGKITIVDFLNDGSVGVGSTEFIVLSPKLVSTEYLYHLCRTKRVHGYAIKRMAGTTGRQRIPNEVFDEIMIPLPPESEKMIIEKKIENAEKTVVTLLKKIDQQSVPEER